jgi:hypothetical protein
VDGAGEGGEGEGAGGAVEGLVLGFLIEVGDGNDGDVVERGVVGEGGEVFAELAGGVLVDAVEEGGDGVEDDAVDVVAFDGEGEFVEVGLEGEGLVALGVGVEAAEGDDAAEVGVLGSEPWEDGVVEFVFGGEEEGVAWGEGGRFGFWS